jgi:parallel beta-helix repeat protein
MRSSYSLTLVILLLLSATTFAMSSSRSSAYSHSDPIYIDGDGDLIPQNGVSGGIGTEEDPYVIEGYSISATVHQQDPLSGVGVFICNTTAHLVVRDSMISGQTVATWIIGCSNVSLVNLELESPLLCINISNCRDVMIENSSALSTSQMAVLISDSSGVSIIESEFEAKYQGLYPSEPAHTIYAVACHELVLTRNKITGNHTSDGFSAEACESVILEGNQLTLCDKGLLFTDSSDVAIEGTYASENGCGIILLACEDVELTGSYVTASSESPGAIFSSCSHICVTRNEFIGNSRGGLWLPSCTDILVTNNSATSNGNCGFELDECDNVLVDGNVATNNYQGISAAKCSNFTIRGNNVSVNSDDGIIISESFSLASVESNVVLANAEHGVYCGNCRNISIVNNSIELNYESGLSLNSVWESRVAFNIVSHNNAYGIQLHMAEGDKCEIVWNEIASNGDIGLLLSEATDIEGAVHHNGFIDNDRQMVCWFQNTALDDGYPSGGNYWSDYFWGDEYCGPDQDEAGADGIGDYPMLVDFGGVDRYPLKSWPDSTPPRTNITTNSTTGENGWHISSVEVGMTAADVYTGVDRTMYRIDSGNWSEFLETFEIDEDGRHLVEYFSEDLEGNRETTKETVIGIDRVPPYLEIDQEDGAIFRASIVEISWLCIDESSGLDRCEYSIDGSDFVSLYAVSVELSGLGSGEHTLMVIAIDNAGHSTNASITFIVEPEASPYDWVIVAGTISAAVAAGVVILLRYRGKRKPEGDLGPRERSH